MGYVNPLHNSQSVITFSFRLHSSSSFAQRMSSALLLCVGGILQLLLPPSSPSPPNPTGLFRQSSPILLLYLKFQCNKIGLGGIAHDAPLSSAAHPIPTFIDFTHSNAHSTASVRSAAATISTRGPCSSSYRKAALPATSATFPWTLMKKR